MILVACRAVAAFLSLWFLWVIFVIFLIIEYGPR